MINTAIGISIRTSDGKPRVEGYELYVGTETGEIGAVGGFDVGDNMTLKQFLRVGKDIVNDGDASRHVRKSLRDLIVTYVVLPNDSAGYLVGQLLSTTVFKMKNTTNNAAVTPITCCDAIEFKKCKQYLDCIGKPSACQLFYQAMKAASTSTVMNESLVRMHQILRVKRQVAETGKRAAEPEPAAASKRAAVPAESRGNGRVLRALPVKPVYAEQEACSPKMVVPVEACTRIKKVVAVGHMKPHAAFGEFFVWLVLLGWWLTFGSLAVPGSAAKLAEQNAEMAHELHSLRAAATGGGYASAIFQTPSDVQALQAQLQVQRRKIEEQQALLSQEQAHRQQAELDAQRLAQQVEFQAQQAQQARQYDFGLLGTPSRVGVLGSPMSPGDHVYVDNPYE